MHIPSRAVVAALALLALIAAACSNGSPSAKGTPSTPAMPSAASANGSGAAGSPSANPTSTATSPSIPAPPTLSWHTCGAPFQCAQIAVPLDWSTPTTGPKVTLALTRLPASGSKSERIGSLFVNPGGPGASATQFLTQGIQSILPPELLARFDVVAFDPRAVGQSQPLSCESGPNMDAYLATDPAPSTPAQIAQVQSADQQFASGCAADYGPTFLEHIDTQDAARDMDYIRQAVGDTKLTYLGYSYGTFLGAQYANLFPTHVRALVLDGAVDPALDGLTFDEQQAVGFDNELTDFFNECAGPGFGGGQNGGACSFKSNGNPRAAFLSLETQITATPMKVGNRQLTEALFLDGVADGLYTPSDWPTLSNALEAAAGGSGSEILEMADELTDRSSNGTYDTLTSAGSAIDCVDSSYPKDSAAYAAAASTAVSMGAPIFGPAIVWSSFVCANWPVPSVITPGPVAAPGAPPILVVATTGDPATPYQQGVSLAHELSSGVLLIHNGLGHTSLGQGSDCVQNAEDTYLINLTLPKSGATCGNGNGSPTPPSSSGASPAPTTPAPGATGGTIGLGAAKLGAISS
ncbi:MAG: alpha/beta hydrolase [Actinomycetota bacterium]